MGKEGFRAWERGGGMEEGEVSVVQCHQEELCMDVRACCHVRRVRQGVAWRACAMVRPERIWMCMLMRVSGSSHSRVTHLRNKLRSLCELVGVCARACTRTCVCCVLFFLRGGVVVRAHGVCARTSRGGGGDIQYLVDSRLKTLRLAACHVGPGDNNARDFLSANASWR